MSEVLSYAQAAAKLARARDKSKGARLDRNTYLRKKEDRFVVVFYQTAVLGILKDGTYELSSGGWHTKYTRERIERFSPARIRTDNGVWFVEDVVFKDGLCVDSKGKPLGDNTKSVDVEAKKKALDKAITKYVLGFIKNIKEKGLEDPGPGDCWLCGMLDDGSLTNVGHLIDHMAEDYYVPTLLYKAIEEGVAGHSWQSKQYARDVPICAANWWRITQKGNTKDAQRWLRSYFRRRKATMFEHFDVEAFTEARKKRKEEADGED